MENSDSWFVTEVTQHQSALAALAYSLAPNRSASEEILQETNLVLWNKRDEFEKGTNFRAWAFRILRFQTMAYFKREKRRRVFAFSDETLEQLTAQADDAFSAQQDRLAALRGCIQKLNREDRSLIEGHYFDSDDETMEALAKAANRSLGAYRQVLYRIRNALRLCVDATLASEETLLPSER